MTTGPRKCSMTTNDGRPCPANATRTSEPPTCPMHGRKAGAYQRLGAAASRLRRALPSTYEVPEFGSPEAIVTFARELARLALTEDVDPRRIGEARQAAALALSSHSAQTQARLVEALLKVEHGGAAVVMLQRLQDGLTTGARRPLPGAGRVLPMTPPPDGAA